MTKTTKIIYYILLVLISVTFLMAGYMKLTSDPAQVDMFQKVSLPLWFMYFIGTCEMAGAIGIWIPRLQKWAIWGLSIIMTGAVVVATILQGPVGALVPAIILVILFTARKLAKKGAALPAPQSPVTSSGPTI